MLVIPPFDHFDDALELHSEVTVSPTQFGFVSSWLGLYPAFVMHIGNAVVGD